MMVTMFIFTFFSFSPVFFCSGLKAFNVGLQVLFLKKTRLTLF